MDLPFHRVTASFSAAPQLTEAQVRAAADAGFTVLINNRVAGEEPGMPDVETVGQWAADAGLSYHHLPVSMGQLTLDGIKQMQDVLVDASGPVLAFCKSGTRSAAMWLLASAMDADAHPDALLAKTAAAGYDLSALTPTLRHLNEQARAGSV